MTINLSQEDIEKLELTDEEIMQESYPHKSMPMHVWAFAVRVADAQVKAVLSSPILQKYIDKQVKEALTKAFEEWKEATIKAEQIIKKEARVEIFKVLIDKLCADYEKAMDGIKLSPSNEDWLLAKANAYGEIRSFVEALKGQEK